MKADGVGKGERAAVGVVEDDVEVVDVAGAVAALHEVVEYGADAPLAFVEDVFDAMCWIGVAVGDIKFRQRCPVQNRPQSTTVFIADLIQDQSLAWVVSYT